MQRTVNFGDFAVEVKQTELGHYAMTLRCRCCWDSRQWAAIYLCEEKSQLKEVLETCCEISMSTAGAGILEQRLNCDAGSVGCCTDE